MQDHLAAAFGDDRDARDAFAAGEFRLRDLDELVALASVVEFRQFRDREHQQMSRVGRDHDTVARGIGDRGWLHDVRALAEADDLLAGFLVREQRLEADHEAVAVIGGDDEPRVGIADRERVELHAGRGREAAGQRFAVAARGRQAVRGCRVAAAVRIEERDLLRGAALRGRAKRIAFAIGERLRIDVVALGRAHPALRTEDHGHRFARDQRGLVERLRSLALDQRRASIVAVLLRVLAQFLLDQGLEPRLRTERHAQGRAFLLECVAFGIDLHFFEPRELAQFRFEDVVGLLVAEPEARDENRPGFVFRAHDADHLVEVEVRDVQAFEQVQAPFDLVEAVAQAAFHGRMAEAQPFLENLAQVLDLRPAVEADHVEVDPVAAFQVGAREQVLHHRVDVDAVRARHQHDAGRIRMIGLVAVVLEHRQLLRLRERVDLQQHLRRRYLVGQGGQHDVAVLAHVHRAAADRAAAGFVQRAQLRARRDDLGLGRVIRSLHVFAQRGDIGVGFVEQVDARARDLAQVVRRDVGRHADRDAGRTVQQDVRHARRQPRGLLARTVEVRREIDRALADLGEQQFRDRSQLGFGVTHRGERFGIVRRTEIALARDQRVAVRERLRHQDQRLVACAVAVRVVLAEHLADRQRGLARLGSRVEAERAHRIHDAPLDRLKAVADERQRAIEHDVHRVIEVGALRVLPERDLFVVGLQVHRESGKRPPRRRRRSFHFDGSTRRSIAGDRRGPALRVTTCTA